MTRWHSKLRDSVCVHGDMGMNDLMVGGAGMGK